ncbi:hypothetical protein ASPVEDRAFT_38692 [Aspergillus versicolor CBS 583.65]|uniref:Wax synthase domain-containing protein n=1 Tax=Aspergillus versicolor CBS 583.65 TaxID=1036611 RepID=A0A1L9PCJ0_ASPVE|nr:uncharacterized protein ASPVEDRAFT_38692 [Aspergillus versicolor CBS 583.65]OJI99226.1 hypothetical protein ASPVEDRAFT_38692 [Aspergillus versicolor CBS 583.65]
MERDQFASLLWLLNPVNLFLAYHVPQQVRPLFAALQLGIYISVILLVPPTNPAKDYQFGICFLSILSALNFFILSNPYEEHWRTSPSQTKDDSSSSKKKNSNTEPAKYLSLSTGEKLLWVWTNAGETRGIGWNWTIPHLPSGPEKGLSKGQYLRHLVLRFIKLYLLHDGSVYLLKNLTNAGAISLYDLALPQRSIAVISFAVSNITILEFGFAALCFIGSASGLFWTKYEENPPFCGNLSDAYTVSRFWGRVWHQNMRRVLQSPARYMANTIFKARRGSLSARYIQTFTAFGVSGVYHYVSAKTARPDMGFSGTWRFFLLQPVLVVLEDLGMEFGRRLGGSGSKLGYWVYGVGYVWTFTMLVLTAIGFVEDCVTSGLIPPVSAFPFSLAGLLFQ